MPFSSCLGTGNWKAPSGCFRQLDLAHFDALNWPTTSYIDTSAVAGTVYYYSLAATNAFGSSAVSAQVE